MIVQLDAQAAVGPRAGVGRYVEGLARHLGPAASAGDSVRLFFFDFRRRGLPFATPGLEAAPCRWLPGRAVQQAWKRLGWPPADAFAPPADVYHFPNFVRPPLRRGRSVVTIHDLAFLRYPASVESRNLAHLNAQVRASCARADAVIAVSAAMAAEIAGDLGVPADRVFAVHSGISRELRAPPAERVRAWRRARGLDRPYLLTVGTIEPRKNIPFLVEVFERMKDFDGDLVLAGMPGWKTEPIFARIAASPRAARIRQLRYVPEAELPALYAGAEAFVFPTLYEGFGFPPLEAMACGTPVIASRGGALPEVLGDAAELRDTDDPDAWAAAVTRTLADSEARAQRVDAGRRQAARYDWAATARATWEVYRACR